MIPAVTKRIDISHRTVIFIAAFLILLWIVYQILDIILLLFVAFIFMSALTPMVSKLVSWGIPKVVAILLIFFLVIVMLGGIIAVGLTPLIAQTSSLSQRLADALSSLLQANYIDQSIINQEISDFSRQALTFTVDIFRNFISFVSVIVVTFYLLLDREKFEQHATALFGQRQEKAQRSLRRIEEKLGAWLRGQVVLSLIIGVAVYIGLTILGIEFALPLAILAALLEVVPVIGPIVAAIPAILIGLTISPVMGIIIAAFFLAIQQVEGHVVVPQIMKRAVGLNPLFVILAISVGGRLLGIGGALLAVPIAAVIEVVILEVLKPEELVP